MKKIKVILKERNKEMATEVGEILKKNRIDVYRTSRYGVYLNIDDDTLKNYFNCKLNDEATIVEFKIPTELNTMVEAIYEPGKPAFFKQKI
ncbi:MAG: hypothetical protein V3V00_05765 [Saprospiraceae bacterium]